MNESFQVEFPSETEKSFDEHMIKFKGRSSIEN